MDRWRLLRILSAVILLILVLATFRDYGYSWDETWQNRWYGQAVLRFITSLGADRSATDTSNFYLYGGTFDAAAELLVKVLPFEPRNARHLANVLAGLAGIAGCWALARQLAGPAAGFWAALFLTLCAPWYGHQFINAKDIPFAAGYIWSLYLLWRVIEAFPRPALKTQLLLGVAIGLTLGVRVGGVLLLFYLGLAVLLYVSQSVLRAGGDRLQMVPQVKALGGALVVVSVVAWLLMLLCWPAALLQPLAIPVEALRAASHFQWVGTLLWNGREVWSNDLPWNYLPVVYAVQLPEILTLFFSLSLAWAVTVLCGQGRRYNPLAVPLPAVALLLLAILFPVLWAIGMHSTIYDNGRQFLFVLPPLACLAALCWLSLLALAAARWQRAQLILAGAMGLLLLMPTLRMASLHPYEYTYLNAFAGGIPQGAERFDTDYWITSYREAAAAVMAHAQAVAGTVGRPFAMTRFSVAVLGPPESLVEVLPENFDVVAFQSDIRTDYLVATTRWHGDREWPDWPRIAEVGRAGMRFAVVRAAPELVKMVPPAGELK